jgi:methanogenic corrinoid protein MtbC1
MLPLDRQFADTIDGVGRALAEWSIGLLFERNPGLEARYGDQARALWKGEMMNRLQYLAEAIAADRSVIFSESVQWARAAFLAREMEPNDLVESLKALEETVRAELPAQVASRAGRFIAESIAALERAPEEPSVTESSLDDPGVDGTRARLYLMRMLERKQSKAVEVLLEAVRDGRTVAQVYETVIAPALVEVGRMWHLREATVADEHYVTAATQSAMSVMRSKLPTGNSNGRWALAASVGGDLHDVGIRMVADLLESEGWQVDCLGANMPTIDILDHIRDDVADTGDGTASRVKFDLICLSASTGLVVRSIADAISAIRRECGGECPAILVGGGPFRAIPDLWKVVGADGCALTASDAVRAAARVCG